jgi:hypothetical protein
MRGRKKDKQSYNETISLKVNKEQKDIWDNNKWIAGEVRDLARKHLDLYTMKK